MSMREKAETANLHIEKAIYRIGAFLFAVATIGCLTAAALTNIAALPATVAELAAAGVTGTFTVEWYKKGNELRDEIKARRSPPAPDA